ncbi:MAG TPA: 23S rRNA (adenine(2503)-C(2))-methyltransferase RlmN [Planctomycetota bacterium]|nr:23S rRNA (adenine(2503)-C(2))-methyltransferase RlmN [Planctomycetota bacterium]
MSRPLSDFTIPELQALLKAWGEKPSHAQRMLRSFYNSGGELAPDLRLSVEIQRRLETELPLLSTTIVRRSVSSDGTIKLLVGLHDGKSVEAVLMTTAHADRAAGCVSSQVGCAMGCDFCASTRRGFERNLTVSEIVEQFLHLRREALASGRRLATLVFMGMGEPLLNYDNVIEAIRRIAGGDLGDLGGKQISVSTVGIVPAMYQLADANLNLTLAVSLHAPDDATRAKIVPMNRRYRVDEIMAATRNYYEKTGRITNIEYCLLDGVNDSDEHARTLVALLDGFRTHVNLIPYNAIGAGVSGVVYRQPPRDRMESFLRILRESGVAAHFRQTRGDDVNAACGQLRETALRES